MPGEFIELTNAERQVDVRRTCCSYALIVTSSQLARLARASLSFAVSLTVTMRIGAMRARLRLMTCVRPGVVGLLPGERVTWSDTALAAVIINVPSSPWLAHRGDPSTPTNRFIGFFRRRQSWIAASPNTIGMIVKPSSSSAIPRLISARSYRPAGPGYDALEMRGDWDREHLFRSEVGCSLSQE